MINKDNLHLLFQATYVFGDGTFENAPKHLGQLYSIHVYMMGYYVPIMCFAFYQWRMLPCTNKYGIWESIYVIFATIFSPGTTKRNFSFQISSMQYNAQWCTSILTVSQLVVNFIWGNNGCVEFTRMDYCMKPTAIRKNWSGYVPSMASQTCRPLKLATHFPTWMSRQLIFNTLLIAFSIHISTTRSNFCLGCGLWYRLIV